jgi:hypothetical protein
MREGEAEAIRPNIVHMLWIRGVSGKKVLNPNINPADRTAIQRQWC